MENHREDDSPGTSNSTAPKPSPEILFLVREHAKTISAINSISKRLDQLEVKVCDIHKSIVQSPSKSSVTPSTSAAPVAGSSSDPKLANVCTNSDGGVSEDSGLLAEPEDELLSILDQIARCSEAIRETQARQYVLMNSLPRDSVPSGRNNGGGGLYDNYSMSGSTRRLPVPSVSGRDYQCDLPLPFSQPSTQFASAIRAPMSSTNNQSLLSSALFEPNVERFLNTLQRELNSNDDQPTQQTRVSRSGISSNGYIGWQPQKKKR